MAPKLTDFTVEEAVLAWADELGYALLNGPEIAPGEPTAERGAFDEVVLVGRLRDAIGRVNPNIPDEACDNALRRVL